MPLATITGNRSDIAGLADKADKLWFKPTIPSADVLSLRRVPAVIADDGSFSIQLHPGPASVTIFNKSVPFVVPNDGGTYTLWSRIAATIALPPETTQAKLEAAVARLVETGATDILTEAVASATYVRSVNGVPVNPTTGNVAVATGEVPDEVITDAVNTNLSGRDLIEGDDERLPEVRDDPDYHFGAEDSNGTKAFGVRTTGVTEIAALDVAGAAVRQQESARGYDDFTHRDPNGVPSETATIGGRVRSEVLDQWAERGGWAKVTKPRIHIIVCAGQSNSAISAGLTPPSGLFWTNPRLKKWDRATGQIVPMPASEGYVLPSFAREYIKSAPDDVQVLIVPGGYGETGFTLCSLASPPAGYTTNINGTWDRTLTSDPKNCYLMLVGDVAAARAAAALLASEAPKVVALLWSQGESDIALGESAYATKLDDLITQFRIDTALPELPVLIGSMVPQYVAQTSAAVPVQTALTDTPRRVQRTAFIYGPKGMTRSDQSNHIHYSLPGQAVRGKLFCDALPRAILNYSGTYADPPQNLRVVRSGTVLTAEWEPSPLRATAYTVEVTSDGGSTWTPLAITGGAIGLAGTATVPATGALTVRASATNETNTSSYVYATA